MKSLYSLVLFFVILPGLGNSQSMAGVLDTLAMVVPSEVKVGSDTYQQEFLRDAETPCRISFRSTKTSAKGQQVIEDFYFLGSQIRSEKIEVEKTRKLVYVNLVMHGTDPTIEYTRDSILQDYARSIRILASNEENARQIVYQLKKIEGPCKIAFDSKYNFDAAELDPLLDWLSENTNDIDLVDGVVEQTMDVKELKTGKGIVFTKSRLGGRGEPNSVVITLNAGDIDGENATLNIRGQAITVDIPLIARQRYAQKKAANGATNYVSNFAVRMASIEEARAYVLALKRLAPMAKDFQSEQMKSLSDPENALAKIKSMPLRFSTENGSKRVKMSGDCLSSWRVESTPDRGSAKTEIYKVFLQDIEKTMIVVDANSLKIQFEVIDRNRYIEVLSGGERQAFTNRFSIPVENIETARVLNYRLGEALEVCRTEPPKAAGDQPAELMAYLSGLSGKVIGQGGEFQQGFKPGDPKDNCALKISQRKTAGRGTQEMVYEMAMTDIDPESVRLVISGKTIGIEFNTKGKDTLIKVSEEGEPQGFENSLRVWAKDLEQARVMAYALQSLAVSCGE